MVPLKFRLRCYGISFATFSALTSPLCLSHANAQSLTDPGLESYSVASGSFTRPSSGPWVFGNDASVVEPFAPNSSTGALSTWSATFSPLEGLQYACTYAGADTLRQTASFSTAGTYTLSVYAASPSGSVTIPTVGTFTLEDGEFDFTLAGVAFGGTQTVHTNSSWSLYQADFVIGKPGSYVLGIQNTKTAPYFINYDSFQIQPVPEPAVTMLVFGGIACLLINNAGRNAGRC